MNQKITSIKCVIVRAIMVKHRKGTQIPIEIVIEKYENGNMIEEYASFCRPEGLIVLPKEMPNYITSDIIKSAPIESVVAKQIKDFIGDAELEGKYANEIAQFVRLQDENNANLMMM